MKNNSNLEDMSEIKYLTKREESKEKNKNKKHKSKKIKSKS